MTNASNRFIAMATAGLTLALLAWDAARLDMPMARWWADAQGFALRDSWLLTQVLHDGGRRLAWALTLALCLGVWWPWGWLRGISMVRRLQLAATTLAAALAVSTLKSFSGTSCPWDMSEFGGVARYANHGLQHWLALTQGDGGSGRCFPAGHASAGFAFVGGYFAFRGQRPALARGWLAAAVTAGLVLGIAQQLRGAHFMSHTLWSLWVCWCAAWAIDAVARRAPGYT
jgi:membrane-associated PAP2 superfamily phosphatase